MTLNDAVQQLVPWVVPSVTYFLGHYHGNQKGLAVAAKVIHAAKVVVNALPDLEPQDQAKAAPRSILKD
jgi:hypothetical protein